MPQSNQELLDKFDQLCRWMIDDTESSILKAKANFLVAQGLLNYTEIVGSFLTSSKDCAVRFDLFFSRMGLEYEDLLKRFNFKRKKNPHIIYDDLRCGLTHEYAVKRKEFTIYGCTSLSEEIINKMVLTKEDGRLPVTCGVIHTWITPNKGKWHIINAKYWLDFKKSLEVFRQELNDEKNKDLRKHFFVRARNINLINFN